MKALYTNSFLHNIKKIRNDAVRMRIDAAILSVKAANTLHNIPNLKKLKTSKQGLFFRIKVGDYRMIVTVENQTVVFITCGHRRDIYNLFP